MESGPPHVSGLPISSEFPFYIDIAVIPGSQGGLRLFPAAECTSRVLLRAPNMIYNTARLSESDVVAAKRTSREKVLIVDDSMTVRKGFIKQLMARYDCVEADSASNAFVQLKRYPFSLVITDIIMPGLSGVELLRKIVESYPDTAVIIVSSVDRPQRALDAIRLGASDYLIKPCDPGTLELTVERAIDRRKLLLDARKYKQDLEERNLELSRRKEQLERLQAQIVHSEKMASLGQLAAGIAHELNNPVGFVFSNLEVLGDLLKEMTGLLEFYDRAELPADVRQGAEKIKEGIHYAETMADLDSIIADCREGTTRIKDIVQNLRIFSRLDEAEFKKTDVHEGIDSTIRILSRYFSADNIVLNRNYGATTLIDAYAGQLNQVWMNLLVNAAQALGPKGGEVHVVTTSDPGWMRVAISDTGQGISPDDLKRIFDPFYTTKPVGEGTGLGLSIAFGIVERHGGSIEVISEPGAGTTFTVNLPIGAKSVSHSANIG